MKKTMVLIFSLLMLSNSYAYTLDQWANAIRITEGVHSKYPYGIKSIKVTNALQARKVCKNTVRHAFRDFVSNNGNITDLKAFVVFLSNRYCPPSVDFQGNINWKHNVLSILGGSHV